MNSHQYNLPFYRVYLRNRSPLRLSHISSYQNVKDVGALEVRVSGGSGFLKDLCTVEARVSGGSGFLKDVCTVEV